MKKILPTQSIFEREAESLRRIVKEREPTYKEEIAFGLALIVNTKNGRMIYVNIPGEQGISSTITSPYPQEG